MPTLTLKIKLHHVLSSFNVFHQSYFQATWHHKSGSMISTFGKFDKVMPIQHFNAKKHYSKLLHCQEIDAP